MQYDDDYERRRSYIARKREERKRQRTVRIIIFLLVLGAIALVLGIGGWFYFQHKKNGTSPEGSLAQSQENGEAGSASSGGEQPGGELSQTDSSGGNSSGTGAGSAEETGLEALLSRAQALADTYDYDGAIALLQASEEYKEDPQVLEAIASCEETKTALVKADISSIPHVFFHSIIMDNAKAFDGDADTNGYNQVMTTKKEFLAILEQMYERGYVLLRLHDLAHVETDENGNEKMTAGEILLPPGKKPFVMSQDDVCYYEYMDGDGFASRIVVGEDGKPTCEMKLDDGTVSVGSYDLVPLLEDFIKKHPDFSYKGARAVIALTGYQGVFGYRTDPTYQDSNPTYEADLESAKKVAQCLRDNGWELASHSWGHINYNSRSAEDVITDAEKWEDRVESLIGETDVILYPFGADINDWHPYSHDNAKYDALYNMGFRYYCNVDSSRSWVQLGTDYLRQGRRNLDGYRMYYDLPETNPSKTYLDDLFDVSTVFDRERPTPVPPM